MEAPPVAHVLLGGLVFGTALYRVRIVLLVEACQKTVRAYRVLLGVKSADES